MVASAQISCILLPAFKDLRTCQLGRDQWAQTALYLPRAVLASYEARFCMVMNAAHNHKSMKFILGVKDGMTQCFDENGVCHPATVLRVAPHTVSQLRTVEANGYDAVQVASVDQKEHRVAKAQKGQFAAPKRFVKEFRARANHGENVEGFEAGQTLDASVFAPGDMVIVSATSKGKGFQGVVKRHGFAGGRASHGQKHSHREPGSIGGGGRAGGRVIKGMRMAGRMGGDRITVKNLTVLQVNADEQLLLIKGAIPGRKGTVVEVRGIAA